MPLTDPTFPGGETVLEAIGAGCIRDAFDGVYRHLIGVYLNQDKNYRVDMPANSPVF